MSFKQPFRHAVSYYSHLDAGAPQLLRQDGVIKNILKSCLVTGYGAKPAAGWTALFENDNNIVLRLPLTVGSYPDIKVENGASKHRIVTQDNPTGIDDSNEIASVNLLGRDQYSGTEWHLIVSDFGFVLCYQMGYNAYSGDRNYLLYVGDTQSLLDSSGGVFMANSNRANLIDGTINDFHRGTLDTVTSGYVGSFFKDMRVSTIFDSQKHYLKLNFAEKSINDDYSVQRVLIGDTSVLPFFCSLTHNYGSTATSVVSIDGRSMLRYVNVGHQKNDDFALGWRSMFIPLDYWEL